MYAHSSARAQDNGRSRRSRPLNELHIQPSISPTITTTITTTVITTITTTVTSTGSTAAPRLARNNYVGGFSRHWL